LFLRLQHPDCPSGKAAQRFIFAFLSRVYTTVDLLDRHEKQNYGLHGTAPPSVKYESKKKLADAPDAYNYESDQFMDNNIEFSLCAEGAQKQSKSQQLKIGPPSYAHKLNNGTVSEYSWKQSRQDPLQPPIILNRASSSKIRRSKPRCPV
jgi:hypothetical protein